MTKLFRKKRRRIGIYAAIVIGALAVAGVEQVEPGTVAEWVDQASRLSGAISGILALFHIKDDEPGHTLDE